MLHYVLRHLSTIFVCCFIATSSYVLFDLLDIDGSNLQIYSQFCGEAVISASGQVSKPSEVDVPTPNLAFPRSLLLAQGHLALLALRPTLPTIFFQFSVFPRKATRLQSPSLDCETDPARPLT